MSVLNLNPLHSRTLGFDDLFQELDRISSQQFANFPPYDLVEIGPNRYEIVLAVAGFAPGDLEIVSENGKLVVATVGQSGGASKDQGVQYEDDLGDAKDYPRVIHRGIAKRDFRQVFRLAEHVEVQDVTMDNGLLTIRLERIIPEEKKPRRIEIQRALPKA